jgi:hypothetical protein
MQAHSPSTTVLAPDEYRAHPFSGCLCQTSAFERLNQHLHAP